MKSEEHKPRNKSVSARVNEDIKNDCIKLTVQHDISESKLINTVLENHLYDFDLRFKKLALEQVTKLQEIIRFEVEEINFRFREVNENSKDYLDYEFERLKNYDLLSQLRKLKSLLNV